jgi:AraC-like DNA-binding protein
VRYCEFAPHAALRPYVRCYWELEGTGNGVETILPDGCAEVVFHYGDPFVRAGRKQPSAIFVGQMTGPVHIQPTGAIGCFGVRFEPLGAWTLTGAPQDRLTNTIVDAGEFFHIRAVFDAADRKRAVEAMLLERIPSGTPGWQDGLIEVAAGRLRMQDFRSGTGVGNRHFERLFKTRVGLTPRLFSRLLRFRRAIASHGSWADIAAECGYADQSHLIRDFKEFAGRTPMNLPQDPLLMSQTFNTATAGIV